VVGTGLDVGGVSMVVFGRGRDEHARMKKQAVTIILRVSVDFFIRYLH
jgi:hypothetical protein